MPNILVTGSNGQVGSELQELATSNSYNFFFTDKEELDITSKEAIENFCKQNDISHIINCAAYTAVDKAQEDKIGADLVNHKAVSFLAEVAKVHNISLVHISTDYVFDGKNYRPYQEEDLTNHQSVYGQTKLDGEKAMIDINPKKSIIIRTSWVYSSYGANFVKTMLRLASQRDTLGVIFDQVGTPTYAKDLAKAILEILPQLQNDTVELYHYANEGVCSWYDFAQAIFEIKNITMKVNPILTKEYPTPAIRPHYSVLDKSKIKSNYNITIPYWKESLQQCLELL
jgi:dTDP-4-dehydrorhamnose reductase